MKILSISTDRKIFEEGSAVFDRSLGYSSKVEELHIVVFTLKRENLTEKKIGNLYLYPTNSGTEWLYVWNALRLSKKIIKQNNLKKQTVISTQDPFQCGFVGVCLKRKFHLPLQVQIHTDFLGPYFSKSFFNKVRRVIASFVIPRADGLRIVSGVIKDSISKAYPKLKVSIDVLPIFFDIEKMTNNSDLLTRSVSKGFELTILMAS